jgi:hypothetical protein
LAYTPCGCTQEELSAALAVNGVIPARIPVVAARQNINRLRMPVILLAGNDFGSETWPLAQGERPGCHRGTG